MRNQDPLASLDTGALSAALSALPPHEAAKPKARLDIDTILAEAPTSQLRPIPTSRRQPSFVEHLE